MIKPVVTVTLPEDALFHLIFIDDTPTGCGVWGTFSQELTMLTLCSSVVSEGTIKSLSQERL